MNIYALKLYISSWLRQRGETWNETQNCLGQQTMAVTVLYFTWVTIINLLKWPQKSSSWIVCMMYMYGNSHIYFFSLSLSLFLSLSVSLPLSLSLPLKHSTFNLYILLSHYLKAVNFKVWIHKTRIPNHWLLIDWWKSSF